VNKAVSDYMRDMQRRSAKSRWSGLSAEQKSAAMKALRAKSKSKRRKKCKICGGLTHPVAMTELGMCQACRAGKNNSPLHGSENRAPSEAR